MATDLARLPRVTTSLVGRKRERVAVADLLGRSETQLVTITGPGGVGKTRLAIQCGYELADAFQDSVVFVSLSALDDHSHVPAAIAGALDISLSGARPAIEQIAGVLASRRTLLILDNLEHLTACGPDLSALLQSCPEVKMLATSRSPLNVSDEREFELLPLPLPDLTSGIATLEIARADAVALFEQRARAVRPDFALSDRNARTVAEICRLLDGLPLAIELAAVRIKVLSPEAMLSLLAVSLDLLTHDPRDAPDRLQTMRAAIEWSYNLLDVDDRRFFHRVSVFPGAFTLDAAAAVAFDGDAEAHDLVLDRVDSLVDKSLLRQVESGDAEPLFSMLRTIRDFGREALAEAGELELIRDRHLVWCLAMAEDAASHFYKSDHWDRATRLLDELDNFREALAWAAETSPGDLLPRLTASLANSWMASGALREGEAWLAFAIERDEGKNPLVLVKNLVGAGLISTFQGNFERAREIWAMARPLAADVAEPRWLGFVDFGRGLGEQDEGRPDLAHRSFESALATFRRRNRAEFLEGIALANLGIVTARLGDIESGRRILTKALEINCAGNHSWNITLTLRYLGQVAKDSGDLDEAEDYFKSALQIEVLGILRWHVANSLEGLAEVSWLRRRPAKAARLYAVADRIRTEIGAPLEPALAAQQQELVISVREALGEAAFARHWQEGFQLTISEAVEEQIDDRLAPSPASERLAKESGLTYRELDILRLFAAGKSMQDVSAAANISPRTVATHLSNIYAKFNVNDRGAAVARAYQLGLVTRPGEADADEERRVSR